MTEEVSYSVENGVAVLRMAGPSAGALTSGVLDGLEAALRQAEAAPDVQALVIGGADVFSRGVPLDDMNTERFDGVAKLCLQIEQASLPVVAAVSGVALGAGLELALACHYRLADRTARIGFPEVALGALCGAGGTQRAPRIAGAQAALRLMMTGAMVAVTLPDAAAFFDRVVNENVIAVAQTFAELIVEEGLGPRPSSRRAEGFADGAAYDAALTHWRQRPAVHPHVSDSDILDCVEASRLLPFEAGLAFERERFVARVTAPAFHALRHISQAERRAQRFAGQISGPVPAIKSVGVIGIGRVGAGFAAACLMAGYEVVAVDRNAPALDQGMARISELLDREMRNGHLSDVQRDGIEGSLHRGDDLVAVADADLVLQSTGQDAEVQRQVFAQLDGITKEGAVLVAHGAAVDVSQLAAQTGGPDEVLGLYFPAPAHLAASAEVVVGEHTSDASVARVLSVLERLGKIAVQVSPNTGLAGQVVWAAALRAAEQMVLSGADPHAVDRAMRRWGMAEGPFAAADRFGLHQPWLKEAGAVLSLALARGLQSGRGSGRGWYRYEDGKMFPAELESFLKQVRSETGRELRRFGDREIVQRCLAAMANAGVGLMRKAVVRSPADIDVVMVHGFGFPRWRGGPMMAAETLGLLTVRATLREMKAEGDALAVPDPVFDHLIKNGGHLTR